MKVFDQANRKKVAMTEAFFKEIGQYLNINMKIPVSKLNITQKDHVYTEWGEDLNEGKATFCLRRSAHSLSMGQVHLRASGSRFQLQRQGLRD